MAHIAVSGLAYAHPGGDELFSDVSFRVAPGRHVGLVGRNGVGKSTLLKILDGRLKSQDGEATHGGRLLAMSQDIGVSDGAQTVRELLVSLAPDALRLSGEALVAAEKRLSAGDDSAGIALGEAIADWSALGGYELEGRWDASCRRIVRAGLDEVAGRPARSLSGGERKQLVLDVLFSSDADVLLLDEPDNFLDVPAKLELERRIRESRKTILMISHDRGVLAGATESIVTLEGHGAWVHDGSYASYPEARRKRQERLGDAVRRWHEEEKRLREQVRIWKERAKLSDDLASRAKATETRWRRFRDAGPPPAPVTDQAIAVRIRGGDSARIVLDMRELEIAGLLSPFSDEIHFGERVGVIGPNGSGKSALMSVLSGTRPPDRGQLRVGPRVSAGYFTQLQTRGDFTGRPVLDIVLERVTGTQAGMGALARYGLADASRRSYDVLSGGEKARLEILILELEGHNLLLLDEPTDNLDVDSSEALEAALEGFSGTVVAVSHDRAFLAVLDRFLMVPHDGSVLAFPSYEPALEALMDPARATTIPLAKTL
ncbi:ABC-F family ATP-binding cassette domain-containing protein [Conexibacter sp. DBS9H8]|uniref:ABC-F family ATP-binding cassette domain-containing protein n=1 Tax=Conexibacter sp. DBS9H8 TaxID=2937801 RepID=UPI00200E60A8|nr:ATP-binding cassette domain-containing protein [Conexibacter sp. DBS9H8]